MKTIIIKGGTVLTGGKETRNDVVLRSGRIVYVGPDGCSVLKTFGRLHDRSDVTVIDAEGRYVSPGFIDLHVHGGGGADFTDGTMEAFHTVLSFHGSHGTTLLYPTLMAGSAASLHKAMETYKEVMAMDIDGAAMGGWHMEGPYFAPSKRGAQDLRYLKDPDPQEYMDIMARMEGKVARWSLAPELSGAHEMARALKSRGVLMAYGHTDASFEECEDAFNAGFTHMTHFFSGMSTVSRNGVERRAGAVEYGYYNDGVTVELIGDGVHVPASLLKLVYKIKGADRTALVTDSIRAAGLPDGDYQLGGEEGCLMITVSDGIARLSDSQTLAGSVATMDLVVRTVHKLTGLPLAEVVKSATETPARIMGVSDRKGAIRQGFDADIVVFDKDVNVTDVIIGGKQLLRI
ncbi:MAG: N-acetylglucosamine-6-phosphate deacetylase [Bacteroidales bacterium]|nr:N-acetylglucosamine-6-phosphate deacetylase [Bacteroidales bacterium]